MLKKMVSDMTGMSDVGKILSKEDYVNAQADDYIFHEDNEKIYYVIKSLKDEYCFTNLGLIHVDGDSVTSSKRTVKRYEFIDYDVHKKSVFIETAGTIDRDCEIKFVLTDTNNDNYIKFSLDVDKNQIEQLKDLYKALIAISMEQKKVNIRKNNASLKLDLLKDNLSINHVNRLEKDVVEFVVKTLDEKFENSVNILPTSDFGHIFKKYIEN